MRKYIPLFCRLLPLNTNSKKIRIETEYNWLVVEQEDVFKYQFQENKD